MITLNDCCPCESVIPGSPGWDCASEGEQGHIQQLLDAVDKKYHYRKSLLEVKSFFHNGRLIGHVPYYRGMPIDAGELDLPEEWFTGAKK